jgi:hypothetical protein
MDLDQTYLKHTYTNQKAGTTKKHMVFSQLECDELQNFLAKWLKKGQQRNIVFALFISLVCSCSSY